MDWNGLHPYPRYAVAVALADLAESGELSLQNFDPGAVDEARIAALAAEKLDHARATFMVYTTDDPRMEATETLAFTYVKAEDLAPGSASGQVAARGFYLAPHIITSDGSAASLVKTVEAFRDALAGGEDPGKPAPLQRTFAPLTAKTNSGTASLSDPRTTLLRAALTALTTVTPDKPASWAGATAALIPDLPLFLRDEATGATTSPLVQFVDLYRRMRGLYTSDEQVMSVPVPKKGGYHRPRLHNGTFPEAPPDGALGATALVAAIGWWARHAGDRGEQAQRVLGLLAQRPLYIVSYDGTHQERFGHHLARLALRHDLGAMLRALRRVRPFGVSTWDDPKVLLFRTMTDRFLRLFTRPAFRDFLAFRTEYPPELAPVFDTYFTSDAMNVPPDLVESARAYGAALNRAAFFAAKSEVGDDERKRGNALRSLDDYKQRALVEFESAVQSAKNGPELLAKVGSRAGRLTGFDLPPEAGAFMEAVAAETIALGDAQNLVTAFMRLGTWTPKSERGGAADAASSAADAAGSAPGEAPPVELAPEDLA